MENVILSKNKKKIENIFGNVGGDLKSQKLPINNTMVEKIEFVDDLSC